MFFLMTLSCTLSVIALMIFISQPCMYCKQLSKALGFGYLVYHSDSNKYFWCLSYKDALEWLGCTYADSAIFNNRNKECIAVKFAG